MIAVDTSALIAIAKNEITAAICWQTLAKANTVLLSAATLTETLIVAQGKRCLPGVTELLQTLPVAVVPLDETRAKHASTAYAQWGKGIHPASLNFGDCFAYATAKEFDCPLLFIGDDFSRTDIKSAIAD